MTQAVIAAMIQTFGGERRYTEHALKVFGYTHAIAGGEPLAAWERQALECAAIVHDIGIPQALRLYGSAAGSLQEREGALVARPLLEKVGMSGEALERAVGLVAHHHTADLAANEPLLQILMEADYLVNLSEGNSHEDPKAVLEGFFKTEAGKRFLTALFPGAVP